MRTFTFAALATAAATACSLINAPDEVVRKPAAGTPTDGGNGSDGEGGTGATGATDAMGGEAPNTPNGGATGTGGEVGAGGDVGMTPVDPGPGPNPTTGLLVLGAKDENNARYLSVLNPRTGREIVSEPLPVAAIAYDEAPGRHVWFVFTASAFPAKATGAADLEVRRFNEATGKWFVVGRTTALPPPEPDQLAVLNDRLVYLSHRVVSGKAVSALTVLDTADLQNVKELMTRPAAAGEAYVGLTADRGSDVRADALGGRLRLMIASDCAADCNLSAQQIFVGTDITDGTSLAIDRFVGTPRFAKTRLDDRLFVAVRSTKPSSRLLVRSFMGPDLTSPTVSTIDGFMGDDVGGFALGECAQAGVITDVAGSQLFGFNLVSGDLKTVDLGYPGAQVYLEPFAPSVISLDSTSAPGLRAFEVSRSGATNVAINERSIWQPNGKLIPLTGATRRTESAKCP